MIKTVAASLLIAIATPVFAADAPKEQRFTRDGATYVYTMEVRGDLVVLRGRNIDTGAPFLLKIRDGKVAGRYNGTSVSFDAPAGTTAAVQEIAAR